MNRGKKSRMQKSSAYSKRRGYVTGTCYDDFQVESVRSYKFQRQSSKEENTYLIFKQCAFIFSSLPHLSYSILADFHIASNEL